MTKLILALMTVVLFSGSNALAADKVYKCNGSPEVKSTFGDVLFTLTKGGSDYALEILFAESAEGSGSAKCKISDKLTGVRGVTSLICTDDSGDELPVDFNETELTLNAIFTFPGFGTIVLDSTCELQ